MELQPILSGEEFPTVVHGTYFKCLASIRQQGLSRMTRQHVHLAPGVTGQQGVISGIRANCQVHVHVDIDAAIAGQTRVSYVNAVTKKYFFKEISYSKVEVYTLIPWICFVEVHFTVVHLGNIGRIVSDWPDVKPKYFKNIVVRLCSSCYVQSQTDRFLATSYYLKI